MVQWYLPSPLSYLINLHKSSGSERASPEQKSNDWPYSRQDLFHVFMKLIDMHVQLVPSIEYFPTVFTGVIISPWKVDRFYMILSMDLLTTNFATNPTLKHPLLRAI